MRDDRVVLISGAAGAIGSAVARAFAAWGCRLSLSDVASDALQKVADELASASRVLTAVVDVRDRAQVQAWVDGASREYGRIDVLVNVAGIRSVGSAADLSEDEWDRVIDTNLKGTFLCCQAVIGSMTSSGSGGRIVNIGSILGKNSGNARPWLDPSEQKTTANLAYGAAKAGIHTITCYLAKELARHGITVNAVAPGPVTTPMTATSPASRRALIPLGRYATPDDVANAVSFLASESASYITGEILDVNGGFWCD